jgi:hypothetical protein
MGDGYLGMRAGDLDDKPYAKYWNPEMAPLQEPVQRAVLHGIEAAELGFPVSEAHRLLEPGDLALENGFTRLTNGQVFVAAKTRMPRVTGAMVDWWMGWHPMESQRYKLWHPRAHVANRMERPVGDDPDLSDREKYLENPNYVTEYVGNDLLDIVITFSEPSAFFDVSRFAEAGVTTAICGTVGLQRAPVRIGFLLHLIRETADGSEMRSRFWLGNIELLGRARALNRLASAPFAARRAATLSMGRDLLVHCGMEMNHLAGFLPDLYADYHGPPRSGEPRNGPG